MSSHLQNFRTSAATRWTAAKPVLLGLAIGLVAGPLISGISGYQVRSSTAQAAVHAGVVEQKAAFCHQNARAEVTEAGRLDWSRSYALAQRFAVMPNTTAADPEVASACARLLSS